MRDYEELVRRLRDSADWADHFAVLMGRDGNAHAPIMRDAADAIGELRKQVASCSKSVASCSKWIGVEERLPENDNHIVANIKKVLDDSDL